VKNEKQILREQIQKQIDEFLKRGGKIKKIKIGESGMELGKDVQMPRNRIQQKKK